MNDLATGLIPGLVRTTALLAVAALAVYGLLRLTRASSPTMHRAAWCLVLLQGWLWLRLPVTVPWYEAVGPALPADPAVVGPALPAESGSAAIPAGRAGPTEADIAVPAGRAGPREADSAAPAGTAGPSEAAQPLWPVILAAVWFAGMGLLVAGWLGCYLVFLWLLPRGQQADKQWIGQWEELLRSRGIRGAIPMWVTVRTGPVLCRLPRGYQLLVPAALWERLDPAGRLSILRHELAHLERGDVWKSLGVRLLALPHWFNPLAWWAVRRFDEAAEWACDQQVCDTSPQARPEYAKVLVVLGESTAPVLFRPAARGRGLSQRIRRLLDSDRKEDSLMKKLLVLGAALGLALVCLVRFDLVAKEPLGGSLRDPQPGRGVTGLLSAAVADAPAPAGGAGPTDAAATKEGPGRRLDRKYDTLPYDKDLATASNEVWRQRLRYDGKTFEQWREEFRMELKPERRVEAIRAFTAFGASGYSAEAAATIVAVMRNYPLYPLIHQTPLGKLKDAALDAFRTGRSADYGCGLDPEVAVPVLTKELKEGPRNGRLFAAAALGVIGPTAKAAIPALAETVRKDSDSEVRRTALESLVRVDEKGETAASVLREILKGKDRDMAAQAIEAASKALPGYYGAGGYIGRASPYGGIMFEGRSMGSAGGAGTSSPGGMAGSMALPEVPEKLNPMARALAEGVASEDANVRHAAVSALFGLGVAGKEAVPALIKAFEKADEEERVWIAQLFGHIGPEAKAAIPVLEKALQEVDQREVTQAQASPEGDALRSALRALQQEPSPPGGSAPGAYPGGPMLPGYGPGAAGAVPSGGPGMAPGSGRARTGKGGVRGTDAMPGMYPKAPVDSRGKRTDRPKSEPADDTEATTRP